MIVFTWANAQLPDPGVVCFVVPLRSSVNEESEALRRPDGVVWDWLRTQTRLRWTSLEEARTHLGHWEVVAGSVVPVEVEVGRRLNAFADRLGRS